MTLGKNGDQITVFEECDILRVVEQWMEDNFPQFCRRVCGQCNPEMDGSEKMLQNCPIVIFDSYAWLRKDKTHAQVSSLLNAEVVRTVTPRIVRKVASAWHKNRIGSRALKPSNNQTGEKR